MLDMGCGAGHASREQVAEVTAYDLSSQMLEVVAAAAKEKGFSNIVTQQGTPKRCRSLMPALMW